jgi:hypothetical protein
VRGLLPPAPRLLGYTLLAPLEHRTGVIEDFAERDDLARRIAAAMRA